MENKKNKLKFLDPPAILRQLDVDPGLTAADFGCGSGYFSIALAQIIGSDGKIFALDVMNQALESVESRAETMSLKNIVFQRANLEKEKGSGLPAESLDLVMIKDMLFQNDGKVAILNEAKRILKDDGRVLIVEWKKEEMGVGPEMALRIDEEGLRKMGEKIGFVFDRNIDAGNFHYALVFKK